ncbi:hypothetical protein FOG51_03540 [Hanseniaspora uvarum]|jgi:hypothetical protein|uniref:Uncharacterized protein n=1 Tax=Hanseniaspora uvarum TaxID=29833 RepID=A0A1E5RJ04_HANUV|nr:hypothetical protein FOG48_00728 [Hanseniaspora uvarum]KAF0271367.1 hypothetical protein FOG51_03540 [Hanseniaspora uvarum]KAF0278882.1 hypothetical protein FOG50_00246 [Hanseniaspora uvarum]OEJ86899.1 hypothetical protein AWRI3580_g2583 [Hanseniaspora uvarum]GMM39258.1 hypothetical protein DAHU10_001590 [Hanseniaspora uvarum]
MNKQETILSDELKELRQVEAEIISLYFNTVSNYSNINKSLETIIEDEDIQYSNIIDLQNKLFERVIMKVNDTKDIGDFKEKVKAIIQTLKQIDS